FQSSDPKVLQVEQTGTVRAVSPGTAEVTARHPAAPEGSAALSFRVVAAEKAALRFRPDDVRLTVDQSATVRLGLADTEGGKEADVDAGANVRYAVGRPDCVRWEAPTLTGLAPSGAPFDLSASWRGLTALARVSVTSSSDGPIRIVPGLAELAPGQ